MLVFILASLVLASTAAADDSLSIIDAFPGAFPDDPEINVSTVVTHGVSGYIINPFPIEEDVRNHYDSRDGKPIKYLVMHFTLENFTNTVDIFTKNGTDRTSVHYVICEADTASNLTGGELLQVVPENLRAWHAGISAWGVDINLNGYSIGIEHVNMGYVPADFDSPELNRTYFAYDDEQIKTSGKLSKGIVDQYKILPQNVVGHEDIAPSRKPDPGPLFPWRRFYHEFGVGAWLDDDEMSPDVIAQRYTPLRPYPAVPDNVTLLDMLFAYGYSNRDGVANNHWVILAFKKHFSANQFPELCDDVIRDCDMFWAWALEAKYVGGPQTGTPPPTTDSGLISTTNMPASSGCPAPPTSENPTTTDVSGSDGSTLGDTVTPVSDSTRTSTDTSSANFNGVVSWICIVAIFVSYLT